MDFDNLQEIEKYFNKEINRVLTTTVLEKVKDIMVEEIETEVYQAYTPKGKDPYERTGELKKRDNIKGKIISANLLEVVNERGKNAENGMDIATIIEQGKNYTWKGSDIYQSPFPRPFYKTTTYRIKGSNLRDIINAIKIGLAGSGLELE